LPADAEGYIGIYRALISNSLAPLPRVRWEGPQLVNHSLALVNRELELALLETAKVELTIAPTCSDTFAGSLNSRTNRLSTYYSCALTGPADVHVRHQWPPNWDPPREGRWVVIQPWEYGGLPEEWVEPIRRSVDEIWAPSSFVRNLYIESGVEADRVHVVPNGVDTDFFKPGAGRYPLKSAKSFRFLFLGGTIHRKGIDLLLDAYCQAFTAADDVSLVIKDMGASDIYKGQGMGDRIRELQSQANTPHIIYLERDLSDDQMVALYNVCDCLVHPYRGEGFALPVLEAMACALPVIVTAGGATDDFVDDTTGYRVPARKQTFGNRNISGLKTVGDLWMLEPGIDELKVALTQVCRNRAAAAETGKRARAKVESGWTWKHAADKAMARLQALRKAPVMRYQTQADAAVLIDGVLEQDLDFVLESLQRHTYAPIAAFVRCSSPSTAIRQRFPQIGFLSDLDFNAALQYVRTRVRTPYLALVTEPIRFSKHWLSQLAGIAQVTGHAEAVVLPVVADQSGDVDDNEFQRVARARWRGHRGSYRTFEDSFPGCALITWSCLSRELDASPDNAKHWLSQLRCQGVPACSAEDTCIGPAPTERLVHTQ
jgi:glycosyltransferase involved in cell wall biosynthesis